MCDALKEFFKEDLEEAHARGREEGSRQEAYADLMQIGCSAWCYDKHLAIFITGFHI